MNKIPKIIHYCWFGGSPLTELTEKCIKSWETYCPDYTFMRWDESKFDVNSNQYVKEAYEAKKWAFVTDYVRLYALYSVGGIYMDTDIELLKNTDVFLNHSAFSGFEVEDHLQTAIMGACQNHNWIKLLMNYYEKRSFYTEDGSFDLTTNVISITNLTKHKYNLILNNTYQELADDLIIYPKDYFCPKDYFDNKIRITKKTHCIHHFNASWHTEEQKKQHAINSHYKKVFGKKIGNFLSRIDKNIRKNGFRGTMKKCIEKLKNLSKR